MNWLRNYLGTGRTAPPWAVAAFSGLTNQLESIMANQDALKAAIARLVAADTTMLTSLQSVRDENKTLAASLADVSAKLAAMPQDTAAVEATINDAVAQLNSTADLIEAQVAANPKVPDMPPAPTA